MPDVSNPSLDSKPSLAPPPAAPAPVNPKTGGFTTSEFWIVAVLIAGIAYGAYSRKLDPQTSEFVAGLLGLGYTYARLQLKKHLGGLDADIALAALDATEVHRLDA